MSASVPLWVALVIAVGSPLLTFSGVLLTLGLNRLTARETDTRWQREESLRMLRWAVELTAAPDAKTPRLGLVALRGLAASPLLQDPDRELLASVLREAVGPVGDDVG